MYNIMYDHLVNNNQLSDSQWGFRSGRSTVCALLSVTNDWFAELECGKEICAVFFDYHKAFDSVPHLPLLEKLENLHFNSSILAWVTDYLTGRSQNVVVNGESSRPAPVISGVPQGSVLGPLLFLIYINDLSEINLCQGAKITLYADDVLLYRTISSPEDFVTLQEDINKVGNWSSSNFLTLNRAKCKFMTISRRRTVSTPPTSLLLDGHPLDKVETFKYLGVLLSHHLSWGEHVQYTCAKAKKVLGLLYRQFYNHTSSDAMLQLYLSLVRPHLDYAASIWSPYTNKDKTLLENVQKFALRMATRCWDSSYQDLLELVNLPTLEQRRLEARLCLLYRIIHNLCYFDNSVFALSTFCSHRRFHPLFLKHAHPFAHTNSYFYSFVPHTITLWNSLNTTTVTAPSLATFRNSLNYSSYL